MDSSESRHVWVRSQYGWVCQSCNGFCSTTSHGGVDAKPESHTKVNWIRRNGAFTVLKDFYSCDEVQVAIAHED